MTPFPHTLLEEQRSSLEHIRRLITPGHLSQKHPQGVTRPVGAGLIATLPLKAERACHDA